MFLPERCKHARYDGSSVRSPFRFAGLIVVARLGRLAKPAFGPVVRGFHFRYEDEREEITDIADETLLHIDELPFFLRRVFGDLLFATRTSCQN